MSEGYPFPTMREMQKHYLITILETTGGNKTEAAKILAVGLRTVRLWCHEFGLKKYLQDPRTGIAPRRAKHDGTRNTYL